MKILINHAESEIESEPNETLGHLFMRLEDYFHQNNASPITLTLDGNVIGADKQSEISQKEASEFETLDIEAIPNQELAIHTLREVQPLLKELTTVIESAASDLQIGEKEEAQAKIQPILQVWAILFETITNASRMHKFKLSEISIEEETLDHLVKNLTQQLNEVKTALANNDNVTVADILEYEIIPLVPKWIEAINVLISFLENSLSHGSTG